MPAPGRRETMYAAVLDKWNVTEATPLDGAPRYETCQMIAAMSKHFKPRMAPRKLCHPGCHVPPRVGQRQLRSMPGDDRKNKSAD